MDANDWKDPSNGYFMRVFCGFDPYRATESCKLYIYSRKSGRLITVKQDARALLGLNAQGTSFAQGLKVILDDMLGYLPLNPTKQDIAFSQEAGGEIYKKNLFAWIGAISHFYWFYFLKKCYNLEKKVN